MNSDIIIYIQVKLDIFNATPEHHIPGKRFGGDSR